ncbi:hypothetical protein VFPPC_18096 [Pochonia chlamydosporia 170]|uniref:Uncharacterized protein n=1 Tax=Pochonia chlamydosporia 170 TaxID=1380566 RepID=A0A219API8_METCM|nr:hypothetical protein VFPPC_18096 [Pochonia chlamydosporia 170]OWT42683.1 hypothetical protein VFPPC_18096 [Pochonia chlamydosporia 170]
MKRPESKANNTQEQLLNSSDTCHPDFLSLTMMSSCVSSMSLLGAGQKSEPTNQHRFARPPLARNSICNEVHAYRIWYTLYRVMVKSSSIDESSLHDTVLECSQHE